MASLIETCEAWAHAHPGRVVFADAMDQRVIEAAHDLSRRALAKPILLANPMALRDHCLEKGIGYTGLRVLDPANSPRIESYAAKLCELRPEMSDADARIKLQDPLWFGAMMLVCGDADYCIAGNLSSTASVLRAALRVVGLSKGNKTLSSMFFMLPPDRSRVLAFGDCGVVPKPTLEQLVDIAISTAETFHKVTGEEPRVAMLSFSTLGSAQHASAEFVAQATALAKIRETLPDGSTRVVHRMGDLGRFDAQGRLWFCGRKSQRVVTATANAISSWIFGSRCPVLTAELSIIINPRITSGLCLA